ncbi:MAG: hypothetical protein JWL60_923 [Gemmatimonadetes bacterium]|jgi:hypothetical protein|nr:hypothetical protein [Gemmatimonadota bacterium]
MRIRISFIALLTSILAGCSETVAPNPSIPPVVDRVAVDTLPTGAVVLDLDMRGATTVRVSFWNEHGDVIDLESVAPSNEQQIFLPGIEAGHDYSFTVTAYNVDGLAAPGVHGTFRAPAVPSDLAKVRFVTSGVSTQPFTMLHSFLDFTGFVVINRRGEPVWWWRTEGSPQGFARRANGNFVLNDAEHGVYEVTPAREIVASLAGPASARNHHDVLVTPQNTVLYLGLETRTVGDSLLTGDVLREWNPESGTVTTRWSVFDAFDPAVDAGPKSNASDWTHANSLAYGDHGNVVVSMNWLDQVVSIAPDFRSVEWRLGGPGSSFLMGPGAAFQGQHTAAMVSSDRILLFDNGRDRAAPDDYSRALELVLEPPRGLPDGSKRGTARVAWSFRAIPDGYSPYMSSARRLSNGNTFIFFSLPDGVYGGHGTHGGIEVRTDGSVAYQLGITNSGVPAPVYRGEPLASILAPGQSPLVRQSALMAQHH